MSQTFKPKDLQEFIDLGDRRLNPFFVGRHDIMDDTMRIARSIAEHDPQKSGNWPAKGHMQLIQGGLYTCLPKNLLKPDLTWSWPAWASGSSSPSWAVVA